MKLLEMRDKWMLLKWAIKSGIQNSPILNNDQDIREVVNNLGSNKIRKIVRGKPNTIILITDKNIIRIPRDKLSIARCQLNQRMLLKLSNTSISAFVPCLSKVEVIRDRTCYYENKLYGLSIGIPMSNLEHLIRKAVEFIINFHKSTAKNIIIDELYFKRLFTHDFKIISAYLNEEYKVKLEKIRQILQKQLFGKQFKTVWFHGDYKIENVLFDPKNWEVTGIIDWDLSRQSGLPVLDVLWLLLYKDFIVTKNKVVDTYKNRFLKEDFNYIEGEIISNYLESLKIATDFMKPLLVMFWINHSAHRFRQALMNSSPRESGWFPRNISEVIDHILNDSTYKAIN